MVMTAKVTLVDVLDVVPNLEVPLTEGPAGTWTADTTIEKTCHDCRLQYNVPFVVLYVPNFDSWTGDVCTISMDGATEFGGTFGPESVGSVVSTVVDGDVQTRVGRVQPPSGHGYLSNSTITFTCAEMPLGEELGAYDFEILVDGVSAIECASTGCTDFNGLKIAQTMGLGTNLWKSVEFPSQCLGPFPLVTWEVVRDGDSWTATVMRDGVPQIVYTWDGALVPEGTPFEIQGADNLGMCAWPATILLTLV